MNLENLKRSFFSNIKNIPGKKVSQKIIVIECDDWGGIRMPSKEVYNLMVENKILFSNGHFDKFDTIEDKSDLEDLFEVLLSVTDRDGEPAVITPFVNVANPDFEKIRESGFEQYYFETYPETLKRYDRSSEMMNIWSKGIDLKIFVPELHGLNHLSVPIWMNELRNGNKHLRYAFDHGFTSVVLEHINPVVGAFRSEFFFEDLSQKKFLSESIPAGVSVFKNLFDYQPVAFSPGNGVFHPDFEKDLIKASIKFLNVNRRVPVPTGNGKVIYDKYFYTHTASNGLIHYLRNCTFETSDKKYSGIDKTLSQINAAFIWRKAAIISTHRVNFVGGIDKVNQQKGLKELMLLLKTIIKKWPDVRFMCTSEFFEYYENKQ